ncbi:MAG: sugar ABC transporter permease [Myxococcota bacterium]
MKKISARQEALVAYAFLAPALGLTSVFVFAPILSSLPLAFFDWSLLGEGPVFVGVDNFTELLGDEVFWIALKNTVIYAAGVVPTQNLFALLLAVAVNQGLPGQAIFRAAFYVPAVTSSVVTSVIFLWIYSKTGLINYLLSQVGIEGPDWVGSPTTALGSIMMLNIWSTSGYFMVVFLAALQGVPPALYEAAEVDGAGRWTRFWAITVPSVRPAILFVATLGLIGCLQVFDQIYVMSSGGPVNATTTVSYFIYNAAFKYFRFGYAAAASILLFFVILGLTVAQQRMIGGEES